MRTEFIRSLGFVWLRQMIARLGGISWFLPSAIALLLIATTVPLVSTLVRTENTFVVVAETETVRGKTSGESELSWNLENASICSGAGAEKTETRPDCAQVFRKDFSGHLEIHSMVTFSLERIAGGPLEAALNAVPGSPFKVRIVWDLPEVGTQWLRAPVYVRVNPPNGDSERITSIPIIATELMIGREPAIRAIGPQALLRSGSVTALARALVGNRAYNAGDLTLRAGDEVTVEEPRSFHSGVVRVDERPALQTVFRVQAADVAVRGFYSAPQRLSVSLLDRLMNDSAVTITFSVLALCVSTLAGLAGSFLQERK